MATTIKSILKAVGDARLSMWRCNDGYFVIEFEDRTYWDSKSIYVNRLRDMSFDGWVQSLKNLRDDFDRELGEF